MTRATCIVISSPLLPLSSPHLVSPPSLGRGLHFIPSGIPSTFCTSSDTASSQSLQSPAAGSDHVPPEAPAKAVPIPGLS